MAKCRLCAQEMETSEKHVLENKCPYVKSYVPSLKETTYRCPDCGSKLKELVPSEWFWCEKCDLQFDHEELSKQDRPKK
jgi:DNA-directed RNA polymerase subunit RPC12/RpoP